MIRATGKLHYPNILAVHHVGQAGDNHFFVMDYLPGPSLKRRVEQKGRLALAEALPILRQLAGALDYAHGKDLIQPALYKSELVCYPLRNLYIGTDHAARQQKSGIVSHKKHAFHGPTDLQDYIIWLLPVTDPYRNRLVPPARL